MRYLAIDYGSRHTGLAICDKDQKVCSPLTVIDGRKEPCKKIAEIIKAKGVEAVVMGLPINMEGSYGPQAQVALKFAAQLKQYIDVPVHFQDERLSSFAAEEKFADLELSKKEKKKPLDAIAAAQILEAFLEAKKSQ